MTALRAATVAGCSVAALLAGLRWLRVAQREHYLPGAVSRFALRWWRQDAASIAAVVVALAGVVLAGVAGHGTGHGAGRGLRPDQTGLRGRTSALAWTRGLRTLAASGSPSTPWLSVWRWRAGSDRWSPPAVALVVPVLVDVACAITGPFERAVANRHVSRAAGRLGRVAPTVVAITGSYGKTSTKGYVAHLVAGAKTVVASPASFQQQGRLARAVNESLTDGSEVFVGRDGT